MREREREREKQRTRTQVRQNDCGGWEGTTSGAGKGRAGCAFRKKIQQKKTPTYVTFLYAYSLPLLSVSSSPEGVLATVPLLPPAPFSIVADDVAAARVSW